MNKLTITWRWSRRFSRQFERVVYGEGVIGTDIDKLKRRRFRSRRSIRTITVNCLSHAIKLTDGHVINDDRHVTHAEANMNKENETQQILTNSRAEQLFTGYRNWSILETDVKFIGRGYGMTVAKTSLVHSFKHVQLMPRTSISASMEPFWKYHRRCQTYCRRGDIRKAYKGIGIGNKRVEVIDMMHFLKRSMWINITKTS